MRKVRVKLASSKARIYKNFNTVVTLMPYVWNGPFEWPEDSLREGRLEGDIRTGLISVQDVHEVSEEADKAPLVTDKKSESKEKPRPAVPQEKNSDPDPVPAGSEGDKVTTTTEQTDTPKTAATTPEPAPVKKVAVKKSTRKRTKTKKS